MFEGHLVISPSCLKNSVAVRTTYVSELSAVVMVAGYITSLSNLCGLTAIYTVQKV